MIQKEFDFLERKKRLKEFYKSKKLKGCRRKLDENDFWESINNVR